MARENTQFGNGWVSIYSHTMVLNVVRVEQFIQRITRIISPNQTVQSHRHIQAGNVHRHVRRTARTLFNILHFYHWHWSFRRNTVGRPKPVAVKHHITQYQHFGLVEFWRVLHHHNFLFFILDLKLASPPL